MPEPILLLCGNGARAAALAATLASCARVARVPLPGAQLTTAAAKSASARQIERRWRELGAVDAAIIQPSLSIAPGRRNPGLDTWRRGLAATLRAAYLAGRASGLALARQGRGTLVIVTEPAASDDAVAAVAAEGLACLSDVLARALAPAVRVVEVSSGTPGGGAEPLARAILAAVGGTVPETPASVRSGAGSRG